ncbi:RNase H and integrase-like protein, partial [Operophtera brumata]
MALLDEGSTVTLLDSAVAEEIGLHGPKEALSIETVGGRVIKKDDSMRVNLKLRGLHQSQRRKICGARTIDRLRLTPQRIDKSRFSRWTRLLRATARIYQFIDLCRCKVELVQAAKEQDPTWKRVSKKKREKLYKRPTEKKTGKKFLSLDATYVERAERELLMRSQRESCLEDSGKLKKLDIVKEGGLLRIRGRIDAAVGLDRDYKRPIILDSKNYLTQLLITHFHEKFNHGNHATVINE